MQPNPWDELKKYLTDALPGGALNPEMAGASGAPRAALRGFTSGVLGTPGDIESLVRMLPGLDPRTILPTSADVERRLPFRAESETPFERSITNLGQLAGGFYTGPGSPLKAIAGGLTALKGSRAGLPATVRNTPTTLSRQAGVFAGPRSATWDRAAAEKAAQMELAGAEPRAIWSETGNWRGPEGLWRQEVDDSAARIRDYFYTPRDAVRNAPITKMDTIERYASQPLSRLREMYKTTKGEIAKAAMSGDMEAARRLANERSGLDDIFAAMRDRRYGPLSAYLAHGDLGRAYPDVYKMRTRINPNMGEYLGVYYPASPGAVEQFGIKESPMFSRHKSTMLHEIQHAIQAREGFGLGGNPNMFPTPDVIRDARLLAEKLATAGDRMAVSKWFKAEHGRSPNPYAWDLAESDVLPRMVEDPAENYRRLAGEAEARATQARMYMTPEERRAVFPEDSFDYPIDQLIMHRTDDPLPGYARGGLAQVKECSCGQ